MVSTSSRSGLLRKSLAAGVAAAALMASPAAHAKIGVAAAVNTDAKGRPPGSGERVITLGQTVVFNEQITTDGRGLVQVLLLDGTTFTVGPNSQLTIDEFVYDPASGDARVVATVAKGAFRFIGGQTSRKPGGATIRTPVGTIGIRGAMVEGNVQSGSSALFSMIFGNEVTFNGTDGTASRIYQPGFTLTVAGGAGGLDTDVRPRTQEDASTFQTALAGQAGRSGGASEQPSDTTVATSPVAAVNSGLPDTAPVPQSRPSPIQATEIDDVEENVAQIDNVAQEDVRDDIPDEGPGPEPEPTTQQARVLTAPESFDPIGSDPVTEPGGRGLVGSTPETDRIVSFAKEDGRLVSTDGQIDVPDLTGAQGNAGLVEVEVTDGSSPDGTLAGPAYAGVGDFAAYLLGIGGDPTRPFYMIHGTGVDLSAVATAGGNADIRTYTLTPDPIRGSPVAFFAPDLYGPVANFNTTDFLVVEPAASVTGEFETFLTWLDIQGSGVEQKSAALVLASSNFLNEDGAEILGSSRRGSFRHSATAGPANMRGAISTLAGANGKHYFGDNAQHFVIGSQLDPADAFYDVLLGPGFSGDPADGYLSDGQFGTHHVSDLVQETPQTEFSRTSRTHFGFMAGFSESDSDPLRAPVALSSLETPNLYVDLSAENHSVAVVAQVHDAFDLAPVVDNYFLTFGSDSTASGGNTFVNDDNFGALQNSNNELTRLRTDGGQDIANRAGNNPGSYFVSGRAAPIEGYTHCPDCDFIDWGWWGTRVSIDGNGTEELPASRRDFVHLGTWVAGDITDSADLPTNLAATYEGTALGNVARATEDGVANYIATGDMEMSYNFGTRTGVLQITDFDGFDLTGHVSDEASPGAPLFGGDIIGEGVTLGAVAGAFVDDSSEHFSGVIANFGFTTETVAAIGTLVGKRTSLVNADPVDVRILTAPETYTPTGSAVAYTEAGQRGLVGSTPETDRAVTLARDSGRLLSEGGDIDLPDLTGTEGDAGLTEVAVAGFADGSGVSGSAFAGAGDFVAYLLGYDGDPTQPFYMIGGTPTPDPVLAGLYTGSQVREYTLTQDPIRPSPVPFFADDLYGPVENFNSGNLTIVEASTPAGEAGFDVKVVQTWVSIEGEGREQRSAAQVFVSQVIPLEGGGYDIGFQDFGAGRRGTFRHAATAGPANMRGRVATIAGPDGNAFFGDDLNNFVLGTSIDPPDALADSLLGPGFTGNQEDGYLADGYPFATHHVADLVSKTPQASLGRTTRSFDGFMTGMGESTAEGIDNPYILASGGLPTFHLETNAEFNSVTSAGVIYDVFDQSSIVDNYLLTIGFTDDAGAAVAFVDDNRFAARENDSNENTRLRTDAGQDLANLAGDRPGSYMVSGRANPIEGFQHCTSCDFLDWGWWGTRVRTLPDGGESSEVRTDFVHMGTWVAGDITNPADLPNDITATYAGTALGNVTRVTSLGVAKYVARGDMNMTFDFNARQGSMQINDFDGMNLISELNEVSTSTQALFGGAMTGSGMNGSVTGAFVNDGPNVAAGVIGNFGVTGVGVNATGTIAGARLP